MRNSTLQNRNAPEGPKPALLVWILAVGCLALMVMLLLAPRPKATPSGSALQTNATPPVLAQSRKPAPGTFLRRRQDSAKVIEPAKTAEQIVVEKVQQFGRKRRELARLTARRLNKELSPEAERFFEALESGNWDEIHAQWKVLANRSGQYADSDKEPQRDPSWAEILDAYGVAEQAHLWPAQKLLDYGNAVLGSLRPGMVYVGGTDNGRWIPELLNETGEGEEHIIVTQNALADGTYLDYVNTLYADQMATLSSEDSQRAVKEYVDDAQKRVQHDQDFADEPKQVQPGENITNVEGRIQVSGDVAVMAINERLLRILMEKNPGLSFAMQESFPMKGLYGDAAPLGPVMELQASSVGQRPFTAQQAAQSLEYWRTQTQTVLADPQAAGSEMTLKARSHEVNAAANLLAAHSYSAEAEQAYQYSSQLWPGNANAVTGLAEILAGTGRGDEARQLVDNFARNYPDQGAAVQRAWGTISVSSQSAGSRP
jgi:hypothetical protein